MKYKSIHMWFIEYMVCNELAKICKNNLFMWWSFLKNIYNLKYIFRFSFLLFKINNILLIHIISEIWGSGAWRLCSVSSYNRVHMGNQTNHNYIIWTNDLYIQSMNPLLKVKTKAQAEVITQIVNWILPINLIYCATDFREHLLSVSPPNKWFT